MNDILSHGLEKSCEAVQRWLWLAENRRHDLPVLIAPVLPLLLIRQRINTWICLTTYTPLQP